MGSLTQKQTSFVMGTLLGDGYLRKIAGRRDAFLEVNHSMKAKEYVDWKYRLLKDISVSKPTMRSGAGSRVAYRFFTRQHPELSRLHGMFYKNGVKRIPDIQLDPVMLATWFMDDGSRCRDRDVYLNTQQFTLHDQKKLVRMLYEMGLRATINRDKQYYRLRFLKESVQKLNQLISDHVIPSMRYKLSHDPVET